MERLSNGRLRVNAETDSIAWVLQLMEQHALPPAEIVANPNALHELFLKALSGASSHGSKS